MGPPYFGKLASACPSSKLHNTRVLGLGTPEKGPQLFRHAGIVRRQNTGRIEYLGHVPRPYAYPLLGSVHALLGAMYPELLKVPGGSSCRIPPIPSFYLMEDGGNSPNPRTFPLDLQSRDPKTVPIISETPQTLDPIPYINPICPYL